MARLPYRVMLFAAGRGARMMPLTATTAKPLLKVGGRPLIEWQLLALARAGFEQIVINTAWHGEQFSPLLGDGRRFGVHLSYSHEAEALETLGGIVNAASHLGFQAKMPEDAHGAGSLPILTVSGDIYTDFDYATLGPALEAIARGEADAHFVLTPNPSFHPRGDFALRDGFVRLDGERLNYGNIACWHPKLFVGESATKKKLFPWANPLIEAGRVTGQFYSGTWVNVGTPEDLAMLDARLRASVSVSSRACP